MDVNGYQELFGYQHSFSSSLKKKEKKEEKTLLWMSMAASNCLVTKILQKNINTTMEINSYQHLFGCQNSLKNGGGGGGGILWKSIATSI